MNMNSPHRQEFCVRWNSHLGSIGAAFPQLLAGQRFVDVTLACEGHQVHCHRLVLAACSSYFESILAENPCKHPVIILPSEIKLWEIQALVDFMYKGEVNVTQAGLPQLLRCAEQLRIRGLYGSDAALNLNQLKALTNKAVAAASGGGSGGGGNSVAGGVIVGGNSGNVVLGGLHDSAETDDTTTNSTTATSSTTTAASNNNRLQQTQQQQQHQSAQQQVVVKKEFAAIQTHQSNGNLEQQQQQQQPPAQLTHQQQQQQQQNHQKTRTSATHIGSSDFDESPDESTSKSYDQYDDYTPTSANNPISINKTQTPTNAVTAMTAMAVAAANTGSTVTVGNVVSAASNQTHLDSTIEDDHNYVAAHEEDDSFCGVASTDTEHEISANSSGSHLGSLADASASYKRVRRSEASLAQAAKCVSRGQTFQTVSNMFNIPVSTIRFYMARKGILPKRKRGRGASTVAATSNISSTNVLPDSIMSQPLAQVKMEPQTAPYHMLGYKMNEQGATNMT